ncbi:MAG: hypothetical protein Q8O67_21540 [Deltaproteobacteria bacterium]|nr:hypothetical protein [Deltaproteobacteria bacterium]
MTASASALAPLAIRLVDVVHHFDRAQRLLNSCCKIAFRTHEFGDEALAFVEQELGDFAHSRCRSRVSGSLRHLVDVVGSRELSRISRRQMSARRSTREGEVTAARDGPNGPEHLRSDRLCLLLERDRARSACPSTELNWSIDEPAKLRCGVVTDEPSR